MKDLAQNEYAFIAMGIGMAFGMMPLGAISLWGYRWPIAAADGMVVLGGNFAVRQLTSDPSSPVEKIT